MHYKVYLILAHKKPEQLEELINILQDGTSLFFVHVDKKADLNMFSALKSIKSCQLVTKREKGVWGGFGIVQGTLNGIKLIHDYMKDKYPGQSYHSIILSGEDLPLKSNDQIQQYLSNNKGYSIIPHWKLPYQNWWKGGLFRFERCYYFDYQKHKRLNKLLNKFIKKLKLNFLIPINRLNNHFPNLELYGSSQWMILSDSLIKKMSYETFEIKTLKSIFRTVLLPDETFIITYIYNFLEDETKWLINQPTHLVLFNGNNNNPKYLSVADLDINEKDNLFFARKFDKNINPESMAYVKNKIIL